MQPLAVSLANYISNVAGARQPTRTARSWPARVVLAVPAVALFIAFQRQFTSSDIGSGVKG